MSDAAAPAATAMPVAAPATPAIPPIAPPVPAPAADTMTLTTAQLNERLERAKSTLLKDLGVEDAEKAKAAIAAAKKAEDDAKTAAQKLGETSTKLTAAESELARHKGATATFAKEALAPLTDAQRAQVSAAITAAGGNADDPATQIGMVAALRAGWAVTPPAAPATALDAPKPPATTAPAPKAPPAADPTSPPNHAQVFAETNKVNPFLAAEYALRHPLEVFPDPKP